MKKVKFLNCQIDLSKHNFSPRIETEFWVAKEIKNLKSKNKNCNPKIKILDIFAGTGCIGIAILKNIENSDLDFADISENAFLQIKINLELNKIKEGRGMIYKSNLFEKLKGQKYDFIFANPPYVALDRISEVQIGVLKKEPLVALFAGKDGLVIIERFFKKAKKHLNPGGKIFLEFDPLQKEKINKILERENLKAEFKKDQFGKIRWVAAR